MKNGFDSLMESLRFNIYSGNPDSPILQFVLANFPYLIQETTPGGWTIYPVAPVEKPVPGKRSLVIDRHPQINSQHTGVTIDFLTAEWSDGKPGIDRMRVWIHFDNKVAAAESQKELTRKFLDVGAMVISSADDHGLLLSVYRHPNMYDLNSVKLYLRENPNGGYSLLLLFGDDELDSW